jgi:RimJ/RimL family protein N-acetyltransferase
VVRLRPPEDRDAHRIAQICADPEIARWTNVPSPYTLEDAHGWIALAAIEREHGTGLHLVAVRSADDRVVGAASLRLHDGPEPFGDAGYWVAADARRSGIARRSVELVTAHAFDGLSLRRVEIVIAPGNEASLAVARRCGYREDRRELREFKGALMEFAVFEKERDG